MQTIRSNIDFVWTKATIERMVGNVERVLVGKRKVIEQSLVALLCNGHILLEDVPGVGKTVLARALARSIDLQSTRIQFTPDLLPSDVTGSSVYSPKTGEFTFMPGPVFTNFLIADEINRATPRSQSALLECMAENRISIDGNTHELPEIFQVIATQNPIEMQGTFPLPEAQLDRFFLKTGLGYPSLEEEMRVIDGQVSKHPLTDLQPVLNAEDVLKLRSYAQQIHISTDVKQYLLKIVAATRQREDVALGAGPRGSLALAAASRAWALLRGQSYVDPQCVIDMADPILAHRLHLRASFSAESVPATRVLQDIIKGIPVPVLAK